MDKRESINLAKQGDQSAMQALVQDFDQYLKRLSTQFFLLGADADDVYQTGLIGLFEAIKAFDDTRGDFDIFAKVCIKRRLFSTIRSSARQKHAPLNDYISIFEGSVSQLVGGQNPETILLDEEQLATLKKEIFEELSPFEQEVFEQYLVFENQRETALALKVEVKVVDNALQRIRKKIRQLNYIKDSKAL